MNKKIFSSFKGFANKAGQFIDKHSPEILVGCGVVGVVTTAVLAAKEAPIAKERLDELHEELAKRDEDLSKAEIIFEEFKVVAPVYAPAAVSGLMSISCILGSYKIISNRSAAIAAAYEFAQSSLLEYQSKVKDTIGEKKEKQIRDSIAQDHVNANPPSDSVINGTIGDGKQWFYDETTCQYFRATVDDIRNAEKFVNNLLYSGCEDFVSVNEFLFEIDSPDLDPTQKRGNDYGFWAGDLTIPHGIDIRFGSIVAPGPLSALTLMYDCRPKSEKYFT